MHQRFWDVLNQKVGTYMNKSYASASVEIQIPFHDIDIMGIAWHGHYAKYLEIARGALCMAGD